MRDFGTYFLTLLMVIFSPKMFSNLSTDISDYDSFTNTLATTRMDSTSHTERYGKEYFEKSLLLILADSSALRIGNDYSKYWNEIRRSEYRGKKLKFYAANDRTTINNPIQLELDNKVIYTNTKSVVYNYVFLAFTALLVTYSVIRIKTKLNDGGYIERNNDSLS